MDEGSGDGLEGSNDQNIMNDGSGGAEVPKLLSPLRLQVKKEHPGLFAKFPPGLKRDVSVLSADALVFVPSCSVDFFVENKFAEKADAPSENTFADKADEVHPEKPPAIWDRTEPPGVWDPWVGQSHGCSSGSQAAQTDPQPEEHRAS